MSKAFTREDDVTAGTPLPPPVPSLPPGVKNYLTVGGAAQLQSELDRLLTVERPPLAVRADDPETRRALQAVDQRIRYLQQSLRSAEVVPPREDPGEIVHFGAEVTVVQRGSTTVVRVDPTAQKVYSLYTEGLPTSACDLIFASSPYPELVRNHQLVSEQARRDEDVRREVAGADLEGGVAVRRRQGVDRVAGAQHGVSLGPTAAHRVATRSAAPRDCAR